MANQATITTTSCFWASRPAALRALAEVCFPGPPKCGPAILTDLLPRKTWFTAYPALPAVEINRFVLLTEAPHFFDIMLHNDTTVDYVKLILRFE